MVSPIHFLIEAMSKKYILPLLAGLILGICWIAPITTFLFLILLPVFGLSLFGDGSNLFAKSGQYLFHVIIYFIGPGISIISGILISVWNEAAEIKFLTRKYFTILLVVGVLISLALVVRLNPQFFQHLNTKASFQEILNSPDGNYSISAYLLDDRINCQCLTDNSCERNSKCVYPYVALKDQTGEVRDVNIIIGYDLGKIIKSNNFIIEKNKYSQGLMIIGAKRTR